ncbi:hypothetical protein LCGC14_1232400 [marine sediment metagenome]|uniref:Uncharacterized protein n=1 Tax=marine sediment metagenome TaxID=412755 RepID=A0A0F9L887_9ZZZZ
MRAITVADELSKDKGDKLVKIIKMVSGAMIDEYWGSLEFKFEKGNPLPHVPARESRVLYTRETK